MNLSLVSDEIIAIVLDFLEDVHSLVYVYTL